MPHSEQQLLRSKTNPVSLLPVEILTAIADQLARHDHGSCCKVNRQWYAFFRRFLYKAIDVSTRKRYHTFLKHARQHQERYHHNPSALHYYPDPGQWVREVSFQNSDTKSGSSLLSLHDWRELCELCPNIDVLHLNVIGIMQLQQLPVSLFPSLYHLTLDYDCQNHDRRRRKCLQQQQQQQQIDRLYFHYEEEDEDDDFSSDHDDPSNNEYVDDYYDQEMLYYTSYDPAAAMPSSMDQILFKSIPSNLRSLSLQKIFRALRVDHLEMIHQACPTLTDLNLSVEFLCHLPYNNDTIIPPDSNSDDDDDITTRGDTSKKKRGLPLQQLQRLCITTTAPFHGYDAIMTSGWMEYILSTYLNLDRLKLGSHIITESTSSSTLSSPNNNNSQYDVVLTRHGLSLDHLGQIQNELVRFIACLRSSSKHPLSRSSHHNLMTRMRMQPSTLTTTRTPHDLQRHYHHHHPYYHNNKCTTSDIQHALADAPVDLFDIRLKFHHPIHSYNNSSNIVQLDLIGKQQQEDIVGAGSSSSSSSTSSSSSSDFPHTLNIDMLLTHLPFLRQLNAEAVSLERGQRNASVTVVDPKEQQHHHHPLRAMILKRSWVCDSALDSVILRCPRLNQLALVDCSLLLLSQKRNNASFTLYMPNHVMQKIVLQGVSLTDYSGVLLAFDDYPIRLVQLVTINALPRFVLSDAYEDQGNDDPWCCYTSTIQCRSLDQLIVK
ncbi:hypothetical protein BDB00DRAFT_878771 [Zychaea mexicana]|uniref:uncharacterized protein n=1 Tax=Zychaea mexicana TaxID=64656 RepID=UPI0022FF37F9|nr:uncharacterized protein BDB00DRAFT_878771 [Zychaea mexicana]KAI9484516.1 hypothetical protein BDB00DRAFT_878771 [Zychaea mexicana]